MHKIVLIDDHPFLRQQTAQRLRDEGHSVVETADIHTGLNAFQQENPSMVLASFYLPWTDGAALIKVLRQHNPLLKVILQTTAGCCICSSSGRFTFLPSNTRHAHDGEAQTTFLVDQVQNLLNEGKPSGDWPPSYQDSAG